MGTIKSTEIPPVLLAPWPKWAPLGKSNSAATGLAIKGGATARVVGTDIEVNYALGLVRASKGNSVADGGSLTVSGTYNAVTGTRIAGNIQPEIKARLLLDGRSIVSGEAIKLRVPSASLSLSSAVDFMSDKPIEIELGWDLLAVDSETAPFYVDRAVTV